MGTESYYQQLCEHLGVAVIATDLDLNIRTWNAAAARMFGAGAERMIGTPIASVIPQGDRAAAGQTLRRAIATGQTFQYEFQHRDAEGKRCELAGTIAPIVSESSACVGVSVCVRDITRRIQLQDELSESRKMGALGALAGAIAHHFNNILGGVVTSVDYALASDNPAITRRVLKQTGEALQRATTLLNGLLSFAEGDQRAEDLSDFTEIVYEVANEVERMIEGRDITFDLEVGALPVMPVVHLQMYTVLRNIAQNAIEAMPRGGRLSIDVSLENGQVVTRVRDTGVGLDESAISHVFEPFWSTKRVLSSPTTSAEGTGLGLAIAHGLLQTIGGTISVSSEVTKGSCFTVSLPPASMPEE